MYAYFGIGYLVLSAYFRWKGHPEMAMILGIEVVLLFCFSHFMRRRGRSASVEFDGDRLSFGGYSGYSSWRLSEVDSVMIRDRLIQIRLYRPGRMGNEFTVSAEGTSEESWTALTELCREVQAAMQAPKPPALPSLEGLA